MGHRNRNRNLKKESGSESESEKGIGIGTEFITFLMQKGTEKYEKWSPGPPQGRPGSGQGSDRLLGRPSGCGGGGFLRLLSDFLETFSDHFFHVFWEATFLKKKVDFSKSVVLRQREHHF